VLSEAEIDEIYMAHRLTKAVATAALEFLREICPNLRAPLPFAELDRFREKVAQAYDNRFDDTDLPPPTKPHLTVVSANG
jgi:hypothetical protein